MARCKHSISLPCQLWSIQLDIHELVHILKHQHIAIQLHHPIELCQAEWREFTPAIVESWVIAIIDVYRGQQVQNVTRWDGASFQGGMAFSREGVGVESYERVLGAGFLEGVVERYETREIGGVGYESCPDCVVSN